MYDTGINVFCKIIEKALKSTKIFLILPFMHDPSTCERGRVLGESSVSHMMFNGGITQPIST